MDSVFFISLLKKMFIQTSYALIRATKKVLHVVRICDGKTNSKYQSLSFSFRGLLYELSNSEKKNCSHKSG